jgi:hypothetical protein
MAFQVVPNGIETVFNATQNGVPIVNVFWTKVAGSVSPSDLANAADNFHIWWTTEVQAGLHTSYVLNSIVSTDKSVANGQQVTRNYNTGNTGALTGAAAAANAALVLGWRTVNTGRSFRGRTYIGGLASATLLDAQHVNTADAVAFATAGSALITQMQTVAQILCVLSRVAAGVLRITGLLTEIISVVVDTKVDSQRRRTAN